MPKSYCDNCQEETETNERREVNNYIACYCVQCGADKRDAGHAPI